MDDKVSHSKEREKKMDPEGTQRTEEVESENGEDARESLSLPAIEDLADESNQEEPDVSVSANVLEELDDEVEDIEFINVSGTADDSAKGDDDESANKADEPPPAIEGCSNAIRKKDGPERNKLIKLHKFSVAEMTNHLKRIQNQIENNPVGQMRTPTKIPQDLSDSMRKLEHAKERLNFPIPKYDFPVSVNLQKKTDTPLSKLIKAKAKLQEEILFLEKIFRAKFKKWLKSLSKDKEVAYLYHKDDPLSSSEEDEDAASVPRKQPNPNDWLSLNDTLSSSEDDEDAAGKSSSSPNQSYDWQCNPQ